jgi:hypothetical protein
MKKKEMGGAYVCYVQRTVDVHTGLWWGNMRDKDHVEDIAVDGMIILRWICRN